MAHPGRNDPCPCGSGRKFKYCCLHHPKVPKKKGPSDRNGDAAFSNLTGSSPSGILDIDPTQEFFPNPDLFPESDDLIESELPEDRYLGLSPQELWTIVIPLTRHPDTISFPDTVSTQPTGPLISILETLIEHVPVRFDKDGALPEDLINLFLDQICALPEYQLFPEETHERKMIAHMVLNTSLRTLYDADFVRIRRDVLQFEPGWVEIFRSRDYRPIFPQFFRSLLANSEWGIPLKDDPLGSLIGFLLFQLARTGTTPMPAAWHAVEFLEAFPELLPLMDPEGTQQNAVSNYVISVVFGLWAVLGVVDVEDDENGITYVTARPIFHELIQFPDEWLDRLPVEGPPQSLLAPVDFDGLSPNEMDGLIYAPFDSPSLVTFADGVSNDHTAPILRVLQAAMDAIADGPFRPTKTGAFSRAFSREMASALWTAEFEERSSDFVKINKEADVPTLHVTRLILEMAGILRTWKGRFITGRAYRSDLEKNGPGAVYGHLFRTAAQKLNWGYGDRWPELPRVQQLFGFTLWLLCRHGDTPRPATFYSDAFLRAFPAILEEAQRQVPTYWTSTEKWVRSVYEQRTLGFFAHLMGLVTVRRPASGHYEDPSIIQATPLLREFVRFRV